MDKNSFYQGVKNLANYIVPEIEEIRKGKEIGISYAQAFRYNLGETAFLTVTGSMIQLIPAVFALAASAYFSEVRDQPLLRVAVGLGVGAIVNRFSWCKKDVLHLSNRVSQTAEALRRFEESQLEASLK